MRQLRPLFFAPVLIALAACSPQDPVADGGGDLGEACTFTFASREAFEQWREANGRFSSPCARQVADANVFYGKGANHGGNGLRAGVTAGAGDEGDKGVKNHGGCE